MSDFIEKRNLWEEIKNANESLISLDVKGKDYIQVNERVKAFRMVYPEGTIQTEMLSNDNGVCVFKASAYNGDLLLATGHAYEKEGSTFINKTSYIENCETSAIGRCLGMCGFGIDTSIASAEEVQNAINNQEEDEFKEHNNLEMALDKLIEQENVDYDKLVEMYKTDDIHKMSVKQIKNAIANIDKFEKVQ
jgi:hypothetical protein